MICCFLYLFLSILYLLLYLLFLFSLYTHSFFFSIISSLYTHSFFLLYYIFSLYPLFISSLITSTFLSTLYIFFRIHIPHIFYRNFIDVNSLITIICVILYKHLWCKWCQVLNYICGCMLKCICCVLKCICGCVLKCMHSCMLKFFTLTYTKHNNNKKHKTEDWLWNIQQRAYAHVQLNSM